MFLHSAAVVSKIFRTFACREKICRKTKMVYIHRSSKIILFKMNKVLVLYSAPKNNTQSKHYVYTYISCDVYIRIYLLHLLVLSCSCESYQSH